jgi:nucleoside-diphosphate-sugar epimerase
MPDPLDVLLIGGSGFLGHPVARALLEAGHRVATLTRGARALPEGVRALTADRTDRESLARVLEGQRFDLTVDFLVYDAIDIEALLFVPYAALGRYVMISTGQVYMVTEGARPPFREDDAEGAVVEEPAIDSADHGQWEYGVGKRRAERTLLSLRSTHGVRAAILRLPMIQGEADGSRRLWAYLERMLDGGPLVLPDGGRQLVRFVHSGDVARAIAWLAIHPPRAAIYNLAQPDAQTLRDFLRAVARAAGVGPSLVDASWSECLAAGLDNAFSPFAGKWRSLLDPSRVATEWGFVGARTEEYLPQVVAWHLEHRPASHPGYAQRARELELASRAAARAAQS